PELKPPTTEEITAGARLALRNATFSLLAIRRREDRLIETVNAGVPDASYRPTTFHDPGGDGIPGTVDDQDPRVDDQDPATLGMDRYVLTNPAGFRTLYQGAELAMELVEPVPRLLARISFSAYRIVGMSSQAPESQEYDPGIIGNLFDDPNTLINA